MFTPAIGSIWSKMCAFQSHQACNNNNHVAIYVQLLLAVFSSCKRRTARLLQENWYEFFLMNFKTYVIVHKSAPLDLPQNLHELFCMLWPLQLSTCRRVLLHLSSPSFSWTQTRPSIYSVSHCLNSFFNSVLSTWKLSVSEDLQYKTMFQSPPYNDT
jgi:hypothetical protein